MSVSVFKTVIKLLMLILEELQEINRKLGDDNDNR